MIDFANVTEWRIPEGEVLRVTRNNIVLWEKETIDYTEPFYVENTRDNSSYVNFATYGNNPPSLVIYYSTDRNTWQFLGNTSDGTISLLVPSKSKRWFRCRTDAWSNINNRNIVKWVDKIGGNIMSMLYGDTFTGNETTFPGSSAYQFHWMFNESGITDASKLILPATTLTDHCYNYMFRNCTLLAKPPKILPATTLADNCYYYMFYGCTALTSAPVLPATTLSTYCYASMFSGCTALTSAPVLPATTLSTYCYSNMFRNCTSLTQTPALPATTLASSCYSNMFRNCTALTSAPALPATTLTNYCYEYMFYGCTALTSAPALPATTLTYYCYEYMFYGCTALTSAPVLPATRLASNCYRYMFQDCTLLNNVTCLATSGINTSNSTTDWLSGVSSTGTFTKAAGVTWPTGTSGIPSGWTVVGQ